MKLRIYLLDRYNQWEISRASEIQSETIDLEDINYKLMDLTSFAVYQFIVEKLREGKTLYIPKYLESELTVDDIIIAEDISTLDNTKKICIIKIKDFIYNCRLSREFIFDVYRFNILNNWMISQGYIITDENREEKYLEIITAVSEMENESESEFIINKLEQYLNLKDKLAIAESLITDMDNVIIDIQNTTTPSETLAIYNNYMAQFS